MAASCDLTTILELAGLGKETDFIHKGSVETAPTMTSGKQVRTLAVADTAEALDVCGITTTLTLMIRAIDYDLEVDLDYVSAFDADLTLLAGGPAALIPNPAGIVYVIGVEDDETPSYEFIVIGT